MEIEGHKSLHFTKVLAVYEEREEPGAEEVLGEEIWRKEYPWVVEIASALADAIKAVCGHVSLRFLKRTIRLTVNEHDHFWLFRRKANKCRLGLRLSDDLLEKGIALLDDAGLSYVRRPEGVIYLNPDKATIESKREVFKEIAKLMEESLREQ